MRPARRDIVAVNLADVYASQGTHDAKLMIDPRVSQEIESVDVTVRNSDGTPLEYTYKRWGTKLNISFVIDERTPDGVATIQVSLKGRRREGTERFCFWIVK